MKIAKLKELYYKLDHLAREAYHEADSGKHTDERKNNFEGRGHAYEFAAHQLAAAIFSPRIALEKMAGDHSPGLERYRKRFEVKK